MARLAFLLALVLALVALVASHELKTRDTPRGHDAIAKRKRASLNQTDDAVPVPDPATDDDSATTPIDDAPVDDDDSTDLVPRAKKSKACVAWSNTIPSSLKKIAGQKPFGMYTWSPWCPDNTFGIDCFPMFWGYKSIGKFQGIKKGSVSHVIGMNEVNQPGQSQMSPGSAASLWKQYMVPHYNAGARLVSPSVSNAKSGIPWMQQFYKQCPTCRKQTHAVAAHWYGTKPQNFIDYITSLHVATGNATIWVTEVACTDFSKGVSCNAGQAKTMLAAIKAWMDKTSWIETYCWFGVWHSGKAGVGPGNALLNSDGSLNTLGKSFFQ